TGIRAGTGYDFVTGLGTPKANQVVAGLVSWTGSGSSGHLAIVAPRSKGFVTQALQQPGSASDLPFLTSAPAPSSLGSNFPIQISTVTVRQLGANGGPAAPNAAAPAATILLPAPAVQRAESGGMDAPATNQDVEAIGNRVVPVPEIAGITPGVFTEGDGPT